MIEALISVIGAALLAVIGWAVHLTSRVSVLEADKSSLKELLEAKLEIILVESRNLASRLARIEAKLDKEDN